MATKLAKKHAPFAGSSFWDYVKFTIGAEGGGGTTRNISLQLQDSTRRNVSGVGHLTVYLSDEADGSDTVGTAPSSGWAIGTDGHLISLVTNKAAILVTEDDGHVDVTITEAGAYTCYLCVLMPDGSVQVSSAITFAA